MTTEIKGNLLDDPYYKALKQEYAGEASEAQFVLWIEDCNQRNLTPVKDVVLQIRSVHEWDAEAKAKLYKKRAIYITTIAAFRKMAVRSGQYAGQLPAKWIYLDDQNNVTESDVPLPGKPYAARVSVLRKGFDSPMTVVARFDAYAQSFTKDGKKVLNSTWSTRGPEQLEKCAEALAFRKAFPDELAGLYVAEEFDGSADAPVTPATPAPTTPATPAPTAVTAPAVDHKPAPATNEPRPGEKKRKAAEKKTDPAPKVDNPAPEVDKTPAKVDEPAPKADKWVTPGEEPQPNLNGAVITDDDLPENLRPGYVAPVEQEESGLPEGLDLDFMDEPKPSRPPTPEEKKQMAEKLRSFKVDSALLHAFIKTYTRKADTRHLTIDDWNKVVTRLEKAVEEKNLNQLLEGK